MSNPSAMPTRAPNVGTIGRTPETLALPAFVFWL
jgi:hypothetical protein